MEEKRFGRLARLELPAISSACEVIQFERQGTPHTHLFCDEIAIAVSGSGVVMICDDVHRVAAGEFVRVPMGKSHYMIPDDGVVLSMLIVYPTEIEL